MLLRLDDSGVLLGDQRLTPLNSLDKIIANIPKASDRHKKFLDMYKKLGPMFHVRVGYLYEYLEWYLDQVGEVDVRKADFNDEGAFYRYDDPGYFQDTANNILKTQKAAYVVNDLDLLNLAISDKAIAVVGKTYGNFEKISFGDFKFKEDITNFGKHKENYIIVTVVAAAKKPKTAKSKKSKAKTTKTAKKSKKSKTRKSKK